MTSSDQARIVLIGSLIVVVHVTVVEIHVECVSAIARVRTRRAGA